MLSKLTIAQKVNYGYAIMLLLICTVGYVSYAGSSRLQESLLFILGPAWSAADGAMEGSIGVQSQVVRMYTLISATSRRMRECGGRHRMSL